eukprot:4985062-Amphidinium_carterae.2
MEIKKNKKKRTMKSGATSSGSCRTNYWLDEQLLTPVKELHEGVLYWMEESDIELLNVRANREGDIESQN